MTTTPWSSVGSRICRICNEDKPLKSFHKGRTQCYSCAYKKQGGSKYNSEYHKQYYNVYHLVAKHKAYAHRDKQNNWLDTLSQDEAMSLMNQPCYYCEKEHSLGLDRINNSLGHSLQNVRPCCEKCNNILGDIPNDAKQLLKTGLKEIQQQGLLTKWIIPTKRRK